MKYKVKFRIQIDKREVVDTIVVDAKNEKEALKKVKENTLDNPKIISIEENSSSKVQLTTQEKQIAQDAFQNALDTIIKGVTRECKSSEDKRFPKNRIILRLAEMLNDEVETNY